MSITASAKAPRELIPAGNYIARCYKQIEIGHVQEEYKGEKKILHKVRIGWEFPLELKVFNEEKGPQPRVIDAEYTLSLGKKAKLRALLDSWRGIAFSDKEAMAFDITALLGVPCMINLIHHTSDAGNVYEKISAITPVPKGFTVPAQINPTFVLSYDAWDETKFNSLPDFIREKMMGSDEYKKMISPLSLVTPPTMGQIGEFGPSTDPVTIDQLPF